MRIAVLADIHGNKFALEEVLQDIRERKVDLIVCVGDLVGYMPFPNEVISMIRSENILTIRGNYDDSVGYMKFTCGCDYKDEKAAELGNASMNWTKENTTEESKEYLRSLPEYAVIELEGKKIRFAHGSPRKINEYVFGNTNVIDEVTQELAEDILVCGHTHKPFSKEVNGKLVVNAGSVGKPKHGNPNATYVMVTLLKDVTKVEIVEVPYDYEKTARAIIENGLPEEFAELIRKGNA